MTFQGKKTQTCRLYQYQKKDNWVKTIFFILAYNVFPLEKKKKTACAPVQQHFANRVSDMLRTQLINTVKRRVQYGKNVFYQVNNIYLQVHYVTRLFTIHRLGDYQYIKQLRVLVLWLKNASVIIMAPVNAVITAMINKSLNIIYLQS